MFNNIDDDNDIILYKGQPVHSTSLNVEQIHGLTLVDRHRWTECRLPSETNHEP